MTAPFHVSPRGVQVISDLSSAVGLTPPANAQFALIQAEGKNVRWRDDGTDPTDSVGIVIVADEAPVWYGGDLSAIKFIEVDASASLTVAYYA